MVIEDGYTPLDQYTQYADYADPIIWEIGQDRVAPEILQVTMRGDTNSQYITFQMDRYYDGVDLTTKTLMVRWFNDENVEEGGSYSDICDARYNDEYIRFAWLLDFGVTEYIGPVGYCIQDIGNNEVNNSYVWKTGIGKLWITDNLENGAGGTEPSEDWFTNLMAKVEELYQAAEAAEEATKAAQEVVDDAKDATKAANTAASNANDAATKADTATSDTEVAKERADAATEAAKEAAESANTAAQSVYTNNDFFLLLNDDHTLTLCHNEEDADKVNRKIEQI